MLLGERDRVRRSSDARMTAEKWVSAARGTGHDAERYRSSARANADSLGAVEPATVSILLTCHNRRERTLACLESLSGNTVPGVMVDVRLVDDASDDGTVEAVASTYPDVEITRGSGDLYWGGGMRLAFRRAVPENPDYLLWLNDDVVLERGALERLLVTYAMLCAEGQPRSIVAGSTCDPQTGATTYGAVRRTSRLRRMAFAQVAPTDAGTSMRGLPTPWATSTTGSGLDLPGARYSLPQATWAPVATTLAPAPTETRQRAAANAFAEWPPRKGFRLPNGRRCAGATVGGSGPLWPSRPTSG